MTTERPDELFTAIAGEFQQIIGRVIIQDQKSSGTHGGTFSAGAWRTRDLNTTMLNTIGNGYNLSSNQFTLPTGNYTILAKIPGYRNDNHNARLQNITDGATTLSGTSEYNEASNNSAKNQTSSFIIGPVNISDSKVFEIQHRCLTSGGSTLGFGVASGNEFAVDEEVYTIVYIWKIS